MRAPAGFEPPALTSNRAKKRFQHFVEARASAALLGSKTGALVFCTHT
jgi:hypothetical protein